MEIPSFVHVNVRDRLAPSFQQLSICLVFFAVIVLAIGVSCTTITRPKQYQVPRSLRSFARFFYASFLKPHNGDGAITGQQAALESFYKAQVVPLIAKSYHTCIISRAAEYLAKFRITMSRSIRHYGNGCD